MLLDDTSERYHYLSVLRLQEAKIVMSFLDGVKYMHIYNRSPIQKGFFMIILAYRFLCDMY